MVLRILRFLGGGFSGGRRKKNISTRTSDVLRAPAPESMKRRFFWRFLCFGVEKVPCNEYESYTSTLQQVLSGGFYVFKSLQKAPVGGSRYVFFFSWCVWNSVSYAMMKWLVAV